MTVMLSLSESGLFTVVSPDLVIVVVLESGVIFLSQYLFCIMSFNLKTVPVDGLYVRIGDDVK